MDKDTKQTKAQADASSAAVGHRRSAWQLLSDAFAQMLERADLIGWYSLVSIGLMFAAFAIGAAGFLAYQAGVAPVVVLVVGAVLLVVWLLASIAAAAAILFAVVQSDRTSYWDGWKLAWPRVLGLVWIGILTSALLFPAALLMIVPAIVLGVYLVFTQLTFAKEGRKGLAALARSVQLVHDRWWATFGRLALLVLVGMVVSLFTGILDEVFAEDSVFTFVALAVSILLQSAFAVLTMYMLYGWYEDVASQVEEDTEGLQRTQKRIKIGIWVGLVIVVVVPFFAAATAVTFFKEDLMRWYINEQLQSQLNTGAPMPMDIDSEVSF